MRFNKPHHCAIIRDRLGHIIDYTDSQIFLGTPIYHCVTDRFDLRLRFTYLEEHSCTTLEGLPAHVNLRITYVIDPAHMDNRRRQMIIDGMGANAARWALRVQEEARAALSRLLPRFAFLELTSAEGYEALQAYLQRQLQQQLAGMGVHIVQTLIVQVSPSPQMMRIIEDSLRRRALTEYIQALMPYTNAPADALLTIGLMDQLVSRSSNGLALNILPGVPAGNGRTQAVNSNAAITFSALTGR